MKTPNWMIWVLADLCDEISGQKYQPVREKLQQAMAELEKLGEAEQSERVRQDGPS